MFGFQTDRLDRALDFRRERDDRLLWLDPGPERATVPLLELPDTKDAQLEKRRPDAIERPGNIVGNWTLHFSNEPKRQVELLVADPSQCRTVVHGVDQRVSDVLRRTNCDEEPVHDF